MTQKVIKIGTSVGVTIPKQALKDLHLRAGEHVEVTWDARKATFAVRKPHQGVVDKELMEWTERFVEEYKPALRILAKK